MFSGSKDWGEPTYKVWEFKFIDLFITKEQTSIPIQILTSIGKTYYEAEENLYRQLTFKQEACKILSYKILEKNENIL